eukprot:2418547-Rhodomonas_salina.1
MHCAAFLHLSLSSSLSLPSFSLPVSLPLSSLALCSSLPHKQIPFTQASQHFTSPGRTLPRSPNTAHHLSRDALPVLLSPSSVPQAWRELSGKWQRTCQKPTPSSHRPGCSLSRRTGAVQMVLRVAC